MNISDALIVRSVKAAVGCVVSVVLGLHWTIQLLVVAIGCDILTGLIAAGIARKLDSNTSYVGLAKKGLMLTIVAFAEISSRIANLYIAVPWSGELWTLGAALAGYYCVHESLSIAENLGRSGVPLPQFMMVALVRLRNTVDGAAESAESAESKE